MLKKILFICLATLFFSSCKENDNSKKGNSDNFERGAMLQNYANNLILPQFSDLQKELTRLISTKDSFVNFPDLASLENFKAQWKVAYKSWQFVEMYNIGKAEDILYSFQMNIYPTSVTDIENNIKKGTYDLTHPNNNDAVGFPALDYLLYGASGEDIVLAFTTGPDATNRKKYLSDVTNQMLSLTNVVLTDWNTSYKDVFVNSTENTATSATNKIINDYIYYFEKGLRANKIGIPAGVFSTSPLPDKIEGLYSKELSKELVLDALQASKDFFNGKYYKDSKEGQSLKSYLLYLKKEELANSINEKFTLAEETVKNLNPDFGQQINTDNTKMTLCYDALQKIVILLKLDMLQAINVTVDYADADGD